MFLSFVMSAGLVVLLEGGAVKRIRIADRNDANARAAELRAMVKEWCALAAPSRRSRPATGSSHRSTSRQTKARGGAIGDDRVRPRFTHNGG